MQQTCSAAAELIVVVIVRVTKKNNEINRIDLKPDIDENVCLNPCLILQ